MKKRVSTIFIILSVIYCSFSCPILALDTQNNNIINETQDEMQNTVQEDNMTILQNKHNELQNQVTESNEQLKGVQTVLSDTMQQIQNLNEKIDAYQAEIDSYGKEAVNLEESISKLESELVIAEANYKEKKEILEKRLIVLYETGETTYLDVLLNSTSITDFISRYYLITQIADYDEKLLEESEIEKLRIETAKQTLESQKKKYSVAKDNTEKTAIVLENTRAIKNNYINKLTDEEKKLQEQIDDYNQQIKNLEQEIAILATANLGTDYIGGNFLWPVPGYTRITSPFGMRLHPITQVYKLHTGTDIGAPEGTNFLAMNSGVVVKSGYNGAYGNVVMIDHGGGISTLYAHGLERLVEVGQQVTKGQPVLKVGMTGYSTGPHAHFEVRINGEYIDPMKVVRPQ